MPSESSAETVVVDEFDADKTPTKNVNSARERRPLLTFIMMGAQTKDYGGEPMLKRAYCRRQKKNVFEEVRPIVSEILSRLSHLWTGDATNFICPSLCTRLEPS